MNRAIGCLAGLSALASGMFALTGPTAAQAAASVIEEIMVTARKRQESLQDVPVAIQALDNEQIERYAATSFEEIADMANQVEIFSSPQGAGGSFRIRGYGSSIGDAGIDSSVAINIDGVQTSRGHTAFLAFFDTERVEILKGPQALFFGKDSPAGVISVASAMPTDTFTARVRAGYETEAEEKIVEAMLSGPLSDTLRGRLAIRGTDMEGWVKNTAGFLENSGGEIVPTQPYDFPGGKGTPGAEETITARGTLDWQPTDNFRAIGRLTIASIDAPHGFVVGEVGNCSTPGVVYIAIPGAGALVDPFSDCKVNHKVSQGALPPEVAASFSADIGNGELWGDLDSTLASLDLEWTVDWGTITSVTGYYQYDFVSMDQFGGQEFGNYTCYCPDKHTQWSEELRAVTSLNGSFNFMGGFYYETFKRPDRKVVKFTAFPPDPLTGYLNSTDVDQDTDGDQYAVYGQVIWNIGDQWELTAGGRFTHDEKHGEQVNTYVHQFLLGAFRPAGSPIVGDWDDNHFSPEATLTWRPDANVTVWAAYKTGYKGAGYSTPSILNASYTEDTIVFKPEEASGGELGIKSTLLDGSMRLNATAYYYEFKDLQVAVFNAEITGFLIDNAAVATTTGLEFDVQYLLNEGLLLYVQFGYNKAEYDEYPGAACYGGQPTGPQQCIDTTGDGIGDSQDLSGARLPNAPEWNGSLGFEFTRSVAANWQVQLAADAIYQSHIMTADNNLPTARRPSFWRYHARLALRSSDGQWDFALIGRNLNDYTGGLGGTRPGAIAPTDQGGYAGRNRQILVQATYSL